MAHLFQRTWAFYNIADSARTRDPTSVRQSDRQASPPGRRLERSVNILPKNRWKITASSGSPRLAIDDHYATTWVCDPSQKPWLEIDLGEIATLGGLEVYWG